MGEQAERQHTGVDRVRAAAAVRELLLALGVEPDSDELRSTPQRVAESFEELFAGLQQDPADYLTDAVHVGDDTGSLVLLRDISFRSVCEHHLLPFSGRAHIAYQPNERVVGLSALPRVVAALAARPQMQERLGEQIAEALDTGLSALGILVVLDASHGCVTQRGVRQEHASTVTIATRGSLRESTARAEAIALIGAGAVNSPGEAPG